LLECGRSLAGVTLHYAVYGRLNAARDNAVLVCHALTGSALVGSWWPEIFAPARPLLQHDFVICINMLGSARLDRARLGGPETERSTARTFPWFPSGTTYAPRRNYWIRSASGDCVGPGRLYWGMQALDWASMTRSAWSGRS